MLARLATFTLFAILFTLSAQAAQVPYLPKRLPHDKCKLALEIGYAVSRRAVYHAEFPRSRQFAVFLAGKLDENSGKPLTVSRLAPAATPRVQSFVQELGEILDLGGWEFDVPTMVRVALNSEMKILEASAYSDMAQLNLPTSVLAHAPMTPEERFVVAHEAGHIEYDIHLREFTKKHNLLPWAPEKAIKDPRFPDFLKMRDQLALEIMPTNLLATSLPAKDEDLNLAAAKIARLNQIIDTTELDVNSDHHKLYKESLAFHEVAADAWSLVESGDPETWSRMVDSSSLDHYIRNWTFSNFEPLLNDEAIMARVLTDPHVLLMKVRNQLWQHFYGKAGLVPKVDGYYDSLFLKTTMDALAEAQFGLVRARATMSPNTPPKVMALALMRVLDDCVASQISKMLDRQLKALGELILILAADTEKQEEAGVHSERLTKEQVLKLVEEYDRLSAVADIVRRLATSAPKTQTVTIPNYQPAQREREIVRERARAAPKARTMTMGGGSN